MQTNAENEAVDKFSDDDQQEEEHPLFEAILNRVNGEEKLKTFVDFIEMKFENFGR
jgi:hypothetical protein